MCIPCQLGWLYFGQGLYVNTTLLLWCKYKLYINEGVLWRYVGIQQVVVYWSGYSDRLLSYKLLKQNQNPNIHPEYLHLLLKTLQLCLEFIQIPRAPPFPPQDSRNMSYDHPDTQRTSSSPPPPPQDSTNMTYDHPDTQSTFSPSSSPSSRLYKYVLSSSRYPEKKISRTYVCAYVMGYRVATMHVRRPNILMFSLLWLIC